MVNVLLVGSRQTFAMYKLSTVYNPMSSMSHTVLLKISLKKICKKAGMMSMNIRPQLANKASASVDSRMFKLLMRCQQDIGTLMQQLCHAMPLVESIPLQERLNELKQRQQFYEGQLKKGDVKRPFLNMMCLITRF